MSSKHRYNRQRSAVRYANNVNITKQKLRGIRMRLARLHFVKSTLTLLDSIIEFYPTNIFYENI